MGKCILVTGGARSGKSRFSENLAASYGPNVLYIATAVAFDDEMKDRIKKHQETRVKTWSTIETFKNIPNVIRDSGDSYDCILLDCITVMLTNIMLDYFDHHMEYLKVEDYNLVEKYLAKEMNKILDSIKEIDIDTILVTNELGWGVVPENFVARVFRDISGRINQIIGEKADKAYLLTCGIPIKIKE